jgi:hypothetical protein
VDTELERAARGAAQRKLNDRLEPRDPVRDGLRIQIRDRPPRLLIAFVILYVLSLVGLAVSYIASIPPAHIWIVLMVIGLLWLLAKDYKRK